MKKSEIQLKAALLIVLKNNSVIFELVEIINNLEQENTKLRGKLKGASSKTNNSAD